MKTIIISILLFASVPAFTQCRELDIMLLGDMSGSVENHESFLADAFYQFSNQDFNDIKMGVILFGSQATILQPLTQDRPELFRQLVTIRSTKSEGSTNLKEAFYQSIVEFSHNGRPGVKKMIILVSDGVPDDSIGAALEADQLKLNGIDLYTVIIDSSVANRDYMRNISTQYFDVKYEDLTERLKKINLCL